MPLEQNRIHWLDAIIFILQFFLNIQTEKYVGMLKKKNNCNLATWLFSADFKYWSFWIYKHYYHSLFFYKYSVETCVHIQYFRSRNFYLLTWLLIQAGWIRREQFPWLYFNGHSLASVFQQASPYSWKNQEFARQAKASKSSLVLINKSNQPLKQHLSITICSS